MADAIKILGQADPAATTFTTLYTVPDVTQTTVSSLIVCNRAGSSITFRVRVKASGDSDDDKQFIYYDESVGSGGGGGSGNNTFAAVLGLTLTEGDSVEVYAASTGLSFNMFGVETS